MQVDVLIVGGTLVIPRQGLMDAAVAIRDGKIVALLGDYAGVDAGQVIDARGRFVLPGVIDPHVHWQYLVPFETLVPAESQAAALGGVTTALVYLRMEGSIPEIVRRRIAEARGLTYIDYSIQPMLTSDAHLEEIDRCVEELGITTFKILMAYKSGSSDSKSIGLENQYDDGFLHEALARMSKYRHVMACVHCENIEVVSRLWRRLEAQGLDGLAAWEQSRPDFAEAENVQRALYFGEVTGCPVYPVHLSSAESVRTLRNFKQRYPGAFGETCPHYLCLDVDTPAGNLAKINPPVRTTADREALWAALADGTIDAVGSDNTPCLLEHKQGTIWTAKPGFHGSGTLLPLLLSEGVNKGRLSLERLVEVTAYNPARLFNLYPQKGTIAIGSDADLVIVDLHEEHQVSPAGIRSYSDFSVYDGWALRGWPVMTLLRGRIIAADGELLGEAGYGRYLERNAFLRQPSEARAATGLQATT